MEQPLVSIVLPTFNGEKYIKEAIDAIINQTYKNWELIIVNDCSTDSTPEIIQEYINKDSRIKTINNKVNKKLPASLNTGFEKAQGKYYTWTSDDNYYYPNAIETMVNFLENNLYYGMVYAQTNVEENGVLQDYIWCDGATTPVTLLTYSVPGACFMYRKSVAQKVGKYNEECFLNEDHEYWLRILLETNIANLRETLYLYRLRQGSLTKTRTKEIKCGKINLLRKFRKIYLEKFPYLKYNFKTEYIVDGVLSGSIKLSDIKKTVSVKRLYRIFKEEYLYNGNNNIILKYISSLGVIYFIKAIILYFKNLFDNEKRKEN